MATVTDAAKATGQRLERWRKDRDMSASAAAKEMGVSQVCLWNYERGRVPVLKHAVAIERVTGISVESWLGKRRTA